VWWPLALIWILGLANSLESWLAWAALAGLTAPLISESPGPEARFSFLFLFLFSRQSHKPLLSPSKRPFQYICSWPRCPVRMLLIRWISFWGSENRRGPMLGHAAFMRAAAAVGLRSSCALSLDAPAMPIYNPQIPVTQWPSQCQRLEK